jgi:DNA polymerase sigma
MDSEEDLKRVIREEQRRSKRPIDYDLREQQRKLSEELLHAIKIKDWDRIKAALLALYEEGSPEYNEAIKRIKIFDPSAKI